MRQRSDRSMSYLGVGEGEAGHREESLTESHDEILGYHQKDVDIVSRDVLVLCEGDL